MPLVVNEPLTARGPGYRFIVVTDVTSGEQISVSGDPHEVMNIKRKILATNNFVRPVGKVVENGDPRALHLRHPGRRAFDKCLVIYGEPQTIANMKADPNWRWNYNNVNWEQLVINLQTPPLAPKEQPMGLPPVSREDPA